MEYPIGTICTLIRVKHLEYQSFLGREVMILDTQKMRKTKNDGNLLYSYLGEIEGTGSQNWAVEHSQLRLKKFPPSEEKFCNKIMKNLLGRIETQLTKMNSDY